jgi:O-antigen ligase
MTQAGTIPEAIDNMTVGFMRLKVHLGVLAAILGPVIVFLAPAFALALLPLLWYAQSSVAVMALVLAFGVWAFLNMPRKWFVVLGILFIVAGISYVVFYDMPGGQFTERFKMWHGTISVALKTNPWIGNGIGSFSRFNFQTPQLGHDNIQWIWCHNEFVQSFFEFGVIGLGIIGYFLSSQAKRFKKYSKDTAIQICAISCISILCVSCFHFPWHMARFSHLCIFFFALYMARLDDYAA